MRLCQKTPKEEYTVSNKKKSQLAEFFVSEAAHEDYQFFSEVIDEIKKIQNYLREN